MPRCGPSAIGMPLSTNHCTNVDTGGEFKNTLGLPSVSEVLPNVKTTRWSIEGGCCCHGFAVPVDACRRLIVQRLVQALVIIKRKIAPQAVD